MQPVRAVTKPKLLLQIVDKGDLDAGAPRAFINNMRARQRQLRYLLEDEFYQFQRELG
jgi:hypothetical protein